jgi:small subunit ribosomal protein S1
MSNETEPTAAAPETDTTQAPATDAPASDTQTPDATVAAAPTESQPAAEPPAPDKPAFRVAIGSLGKPERASEAKPAGHVSEPGPNVKPPDEVEKRKQQSVPRPNFKRQVSPELDAEIEAALGGSSLNDIMLGDGSSQGEDLEEGAQVTGRVVSAHGEDLFVDLGGGLQGVVSLKQFPEAAPAEGETLPLVAVRLNADDGLYECALPGQAVEVGDWSEISEGMVVQAVVTGHNKGGLECEVNHIRGFMPISQITLYRVEDIEQFVGESWPCLVTEANAEQRNLVLSRRAMLEREKAEAREKMLESLAVGDIYDGTVRKLMDFGAFVDIGGVDGLCHISKLSWDRISHPSEVVSEGQQIKVRIEKYDRDSGKISLEYLERPNNPWDDVQSKYPTGAPVQGVVSKLMDFGAFVKLEPGVEGMVHVSEISHQRVWRPSDVLSEGQEVEVLVQSVDVDAQRIGLSLKALAAKPAVAKSAPADEDLVQDVDEPKQKHTGPLKGGVGKPTGGEQFGLKW